MQIRSNTERLRRIERPHPKNPKISSLLRQKIFVGFLLSPKATESYTAWNGLETVAFFLPSVSQKFFSYGVAFLDFPPLDASSSLLLPAWNG
jgi:hypothetical protein